MEPERRPIGYWLKHLDRLIDQAFERALDADGLTRRQWQILNTLAAGPSTDAALTAALKPFVKDDAKAVEVVINDFLDRGWIRTAPDGRVEISEPGRATHEAAMQRVAETRQALRHGITDDEYVSVVRILQHMASNFSRGKTTSATLRVRSFTASQHVHQGLRSSSHVQPASSYC